MARERVTEPYSLPHQTGALEEHPDWLTTDLSSCSACSASRPSPATQSVTGDTSWNMPVGYGLSETCAFFFTHWSDTPRELRRRAWASSCPATSCASSIPTPVACSAPTRTASSPSRARR